MQYAPPTWRHPRMAQAIIAPAPVVAAPSVAPTTPSALAGAPVPEGLFWTALAAAASYAALRTGMRETGFTSIVGWTGGVAAGLAAILGLTGIVAPTAARNFPVRWYWV